MNANLADKSWGYVMLNMKQVANAMLRATAGEVIFGAMTVLSIHSGNRLPVKTLAVAPENIQETVAVSQNMTISNLLLNLSLKASSK
jgi:hypothetical protein